MVEDMLEELLSRNRVHTETVSDYDFDPVQEGQDPEVVSVCCSDSRVSQEDMFSVTDPGWLFTPSNIGNQAWDLVDGERVVDGNVLYPIAHTNTGTVVVVGHTGCGAVTAAYEAVQQGMEEPPGIRKYVELLMPVVQDAIDQGIVSTHRNKENMVNKLVEYNVDRQVDFLLGSPDLPDHVNVLGMVYDFQDVYGVPRGTAVLTNVNGEQDPYMLKRKVPERFEDWVHRQITD